MTLLPRSLRFSLSARPLTGVLVAVVLIAPPPGARAASLSSLSLDRSARVRYNRVEGLFTGYRVGLSPRNASAVTGFVEAGYGVQNEAVRWEVGAEVRTPEWSAAAALFDRTGTRDGDIVRTGENNLYMLLFKGDYRDYHREKNGFEAAGDIELLPGLRGTGSLAVFTYESMPVEAGWSLFRSDDSVRANPAVRPGDAGVLRLGLLYDDRRTRSPVFRNGWRVRLDYERGFREFPYDGLLLSFTRDQKVVFGRQAFVLRGLLGTRESAREQHLFDLGGITTLRGYRIKEFTGNRLLRLNADYLFHGDLLGRLPVKGFHLLQLILFADAGWTGLAAESAPFVEGFGGFSLDDVKTSAGAALSLYRQLVRFNVARRFDDDIDDWTFSVRFRREF